MSNRTLLSHVLTLTRALTFSLLQWPPLPLQSLLKEKKTIFVSITISRCTKRKVSLYLLEQKHRERPFSVLWFPKSTESLSEEWLKWGGSPYVCGLFLLVLCVSIFFRISTLHRIFALQRRIFQDKCPSSYRVFRCFVHLGKQTNIIFATLQQSSTMLYQIKGTYQAFFQLWLIWLLVGFLGFIIKVFDSW